MGGSGTTQVWTSLDAKAWVSAPATSFAHPTIGYMSAALLSFRGASAGAQAYYMVGDSSSNSSVFTVTPTLDRAEVFAVYGDFGYANDVSMGPLIADAGKGAFDAVSFAVRAHTRGARARARPPPQRALVSTPAPPAPPPPRRRCIVVTGRK